MDIIDLFYLLRYPVALLAILYFSTFAHELGHALMARWLGFEVTSFGLGLASPLLVWRWRGTLVYLCARNPLHGFTFVLYPQLAFSNRKWIAFQAGGIVAHLLLCLVGLVGASLSGLPGTLFWGTLTTVNSYFVLANLIPMEQISNRVRVGTDGNQMLRTWRGRQGVSALPVLHMVRDLRGLWQAIGDRRAESAFLSVAAAVWAELGDSAHANALLLEALALTSDLPFITQVVGRFHDAETHQEAGRLEEAAAVYEQLLREFTKRDDAYGQFQVRCRQTVLEAGKQDQEFAERKLQELQADPILLADPRLQVVFLAAALKALSRQRCEDILRQLPALSAAGDWPPETTWQFCRLLTRLHVAREDWAQAEVAVLAAWQVAPELRASLPAEDRPRFADCMKTVQKEACAVLRQLGKTAESERLARFFIEDAETAALKKAAKERRLQHDRRLHKAGLVLTGVNLLLGVGGIVALATTDVGKGPPPWDRITTITALVMPSIVILTALYNGLYRWVRWCMPTHQSPGGVTLFLALLPWLLPVIAGVRELVSLLG